MTPKSGASSLKHLTGQFRRRLWWILLTVGVSRLLAAAVVLFALALAIDWLVHIRAGWRAVSLAIFTFAAASLGYISIRRPLQHRWTDKEILAWLDRVKGGSLLLDRLELDEGAGIEERNDPEGLQLLEQARSALPAPPPADRLLDHAFRLKAARRWWLTAALAAALVAAAAWIMPTHISAGARRFFNPLSAARWPHHTTITVTPSEAGWNVPQGEPLTVHAAVSGMQIPSELSLLYRTLPKGQWVRERLAVTESAAAHSAQYTFAEIREPLEFYLTGGDDTTDRFKVQITRAPSLEKIVASVQSPSYSGVPRKTKEGGDIDGLEGSNVHIDFTSSVPLKSALFTIDGQQEQSLPIQDKTKFSADFMLTKSTAYSVKLVGESGFREARPERYDIRVRPDSPPEAEILLPDRELEGTAAAAFKVQFTASDDFELAKVEFLYRLDSAPPLALSDRTTGPVVVHCRKTGSTFTWDLNQLNIPTKDTVMLEYWVRAIDTNPTGRGVTESAHHHIRVLKPSLYRESLLIAAKALVNEALLAEKNQRRAYEAAKKFLGGQGTGDENDPLWLEMTGLQTGSFDAAHAMSTQLVMLLERAADNRIQTEFMTVRLSQIAGILQSVMDNQHANIAKTLAAAGPRDAASSTPAAVKARRLELLKAINEAEAGQKRAVLELQRILLLVFDWNDLQSAAVSGLRLYEQQEDCSRDTAAIAPIFIGADIRDLSAADQEKLIVIGKAQRVIYDAESVLEGHLEQILTKAERQKRHSIRVPVYAAYSELRNRRVKDRLLTASDAIRNNQPADILIEQKSALEALRIVKAGLEAAGVPEKLAPIPLASAVLDIDAEDSRTSTNVVEAIVPPPLVIADRQGTDPLTTAILATADAVRDVVRRSEYLANHDGTGDWPRFARLRFARLSELGGGAAESLRQAQDIAEKSKEPVVQAMLKDLQEDLGASVRLIDEKDISPAARQIGTDAALTMADLVQYLATRKAVVEMKDQHDQQGGIDPFKQPYTLQKSDLAAATEAIDGMLAVRLQLLDAGRALQRLGPKPQGALAKVAEEQRQRLLVRRGELSGRWSGIKEKLAAISEANRPRVAESMGDLPGRDLSAPLAAGAGQEVAAAAQSLDDAGKLALAVQGLRDLMDARTALAPVIAATTLPTAQETARMSEEDYARLMSLPALKDRISRSTQLPAAVRDALTASLSREYPPEQQKFLAAYINSILVAAQEQAKEDHP